MTDIGIPKSSAKPLRGVARRWRILALSSVALNLTLCEAGGSEPETATLAVVSDRGGLTTCTNVEGWAVELSEFRVAVRDLEFTIGGETHAHWIDKASELWVATAKAHAGHYAGGEVTGELRGELIVDLLSDSRQPLGEAELLVGDYNGLNFFFRRATEADELNANDPLQGHTAVMAGTATRDDEGIAFSALIETTDGTQMVGGTFELEVDTDTTVTLGLTAYTEDPSEHDTLFDGINFSELSRDADGAASIRPGQPEHNVLMKTLVRHDHWGIVVLED